MAVEKSNHLQYQGYAGSTYNMSEVEQQ